MTESELVRALQAGDREVFGDLVDRYRDMVFGLCQRIAGNRLDAEELAHDTFVEAYLKIGTLREPERLGSWLRTIAMNLCRMWCRRRRQAWGELPEDVAAAEPENEDPALLTRMSAAMWHLPAPQRLVLVLHYFEQMSYEQAAEFLDVPIGTVMSRLHRARRALRRIIETPCPDEEIPMSEDERFKQEIQAEIALLLEMFGRQGGAAERLTVILQHSPERFGQLIEQADDEQTLANLTILLPRLGAGAMDATLNAAFSPDARAAGHAGHILGRFVGSCRSVEDRGWEPATPCPSLYVLLDRLAEHPSDAAGKAELLVGLLDACEDEGVAALVTNLLLCYPEAAFDLLVAWFRAAPDGGALYDASHRLFALCRMGTRFCREVAALSRSDEGGRQMLALTAAEALGRCVDPRWLQDATPAELAHAVRVRAKWPPLRRQDLAQDVLTEMLEWIAGLLESPRDDLRNTALGALGRWRATGYQARILPFAVHEDPATRLAAIRALAEIGDAGAIGVLMHAARGPDVGGVRSAAIEALGRMMALEAEGLLVGLLNDPDSRVQETAVAALGELGTSAARAALQDVLASGGKRLQKAAARVVFSKQRQPSQAAVEPARQTQAQRVRGDAQPVVYSSICAVLRSALPQVRAYEEQDLTRRIAGACIDYSLTRRRLVDEGWMTREAGTYQLTEPGQAAWRVEQFIVMHYQK